MAGFIGLSGFIAHGFMRRPKRRRSTSPITINWNSYSGAAGGIVVIDTSTIQQNENVDMVQAVKWDNPIGAAIWLTADNGDLCKIPPYSNGMCPFLVGQGDKVTAQIDPSIPQPPPTAWNTLLTFLSVPVEEGAQFPGSQGVSFQAGPSHTINGLFNVTQNGYVASIPFDNIALSTVATNLALLPANAAGVGTHGAGAIMGMDLFFIPASFAAAAVAEVDILVQGVTGPANWPIKLACPVSAAGQVLPYQTRMKSYAWTWASAGTNPSIQAILPNSIAPGTLTVSGIVDVVLYP